MILLDSSGLLAALDEGEPDHEATMAILDAARGPLLVIDFVLAEVDYLVLQRLGAKAEADFLSQLTGGAFVREPVTASDLERARAIAEAYADQAIGLTNASMMAVAERLAGCQVLTLDRRHFAPFRDRRGRPLRLLP